MTDLTVEELDELDQAVRACCSCCRPIDEDKELDIIAMARDKLAAERERDALRDVLVLIAEREPMCDYDWAPRDAARAALAQYASRDTGGAE